MSETRIHHKRYAQNDHNHLGQFIWLITLREIWPCYYYKPILRGRMLHVLHEYRHAMALVFSLFNLSCIGPLTSYRRVFMVPFRSRLSPCEKSGWCRVRCARSARGHSGHTARRTSAWSPLVSLGCVQSLTLRVRSKIWDLIFNINLSPD